MKCLIILVLAVFGSETTIGQAKLIHWIPLNDSVAQDSIGSLSGTIRGAVSAAGRTAKSNTAYYFDGSGKHINFGTTDPGKDSNDISICVWFKPDKLVTPNDTNSSKPQANIEYLFSSGGKMSSIGWALIWSRGRIQCVRKTSSVTATTGRLSYLNTEWHQVCMTYENKNKELKLYGDSNLVGTSIGTPGSYTNVFPDIKAGKAGNTAINRNYFKGHIDDIKIYSGILDEGQVDSLYKVKKLVNSKQESEYTISSVTIWPNPASAEINIRGFANQNIIELQIIDINGKVVQSIESSISENSKSIQVKNLNPENISFISNR